ncbi:DUF5610 domain-containing protein [Eionea flava]
MQPTQHLSSLPHTPISTADTAKPDTTKQDSTEKATLSEASHTPQKPLQSQYRSISSYAYSVNIQSQDTQNQQGSLTYSASHSFESYSSLSLEQVNKVKEAPPLLDGASNILQFIEQRVANEQAAGASSEVLSELLTQGLSGFIQGFDEAKQLLSQDSESDDGSLNTAVSDSISLLYDQVVEGIANLRQAYLGEAAETSTTPDQVTLSNTPAEHAPNNIPKQSESNVLASPIDTLLQTMDQPDTQLITLLDSLDEMQSVSEHVVEYSEKQQFSFSLTTAEGDEITITADRSSHLSNASYQGASNNLDIQASSSHQQFTFQVDGDLNKEEVTAINDLLTQVMSLSEQFYRGDVGAAYQSALEMNYDSSEITAYALQLTQVESYHVAAVYDANTSKQNETLPNQSAAQDLQALFKQVGEYTQQVLESITNPDNYQQIHYAQVIEQLAQQIDQQITNNNDYTFGQSISDARATTQL